MTENEEITRRLKDIRERAGLTVREMAQRLGVSPSGYNHYETPSRFKDAFLPMAVAIKIARAIEGTAVDPQEVLAMAGKGVTLPKAGNQNPGFAESASPFSFQEHPTQRDDPQRHWRALFGPAASTPASFVLHSSHPAFGLLRGDVLICDLARAPRPGELALITIADDDAATSATTLRRYLPPYLMPGDMNDAPTLRMDDPGVTVRYPVIGSVRGIST